MSRCFTTFSRCRFGLEWASRPNDVITESIHARVLYKVFDRMEWARNLVEHGEVLLSQPKRFHDRTAGERYDPRDGHYSHAVAGVASDGAWFTGCENVVESRPCFIWCCSTVASQVLYQRFGGAVIVEIHRPAEFMRHLDTAARAELHKAGHRVASSCVGDVVYSMNEPPTHPDEMVDRPWVHPALMKPAYNPDIDQAYLYEAEVRAVFELERWNSPLLFPGHQSLVVQEDNPPPTTLKFKRESLRAFCRLLDWGKFKRLDRAAPLAKVPVHAFGLGVRRVSVRRAVAALRNPAVDLLAPDPPYPGDRPRQWKRRRRR